MQTKRPTDLNDPDAEAIARGYESRDLRITALLAVFAVFVVLFALTCGGLWWLYRHEISRPMAGNEPRSAVPPRSVPADAPPLQPQIGHERLDAWDLRSLRAGEDATFERLGWRRDERTHRFAVPSAVVDAVRQRQAATRPAGGGA